MSVTENWSRIGGPIRFIVDLFNRCHALVMGAGCVLGGLFVISIANFVPLTNDELWLRYVAYAVAAYWIVARGLGPIWTALDWSGLNKGTHGTARTATAGELRAGGLMPRTPESIYLGRFVDKRRVRGEVGYPGGVHLLSIGQAGSGKGTGLIVPNLSTLRRSILIIDPKGEAAAITARKRARFGPVIIINPFNVFVKERPYLKSDGFNPLGALNPKHDDFTDDCAGIAEALIKEQIGKDGAFFTSSAQDFLTALIMHEKLKRGDRASLANVRRMLTEPAVTTKATGPVGLLKTIVEMAQSNCVPLKSKAGRFLQEANSNKDIISTAISETRFLDSAAMQRDLCGADIDWEVMKHRVCTIYVILPADRMETHANYMRLVVSSALRALLRSPPGKTLPPVLFMLDEFAQLGYLPAIENAMGIARGYGVQLWPFLQDLNQLKALYRDRWQSFLGNAAAVTAFAPRDLFTAQHLSARLGNKTIIVESENNRTGDAGLGHGRNPQGVPLFRPEELMEMPARQMLCSVNPVQKAFMTKAPAYTETTFAADLDPNPYHD
jgi:type IV secretion system protein VirD4